VPLVRGVGGAACVRGGRAEAEVLHLLLEVRRPEVAVEVGRHPRILVAHDPLDRRQVGAAHEQQRRGRVPEVVKPDLPDLPDREQLEVAFLAPTLVRVRRRLSIAAPGAPALVDVAGHLARPAHRPPEHVLKRGMPRQHGAVLGRKDQLRGRGRDRLPQVRQKLAVDRDRLHPSTLRDVSLVRPTYEVQAVGEVDVRLPQSEELALSHPV
jgi:hypothetical protein